MIIAKRLRIIDKTGKMVVYSHVVEFLTALSTLIIKGERDDEHGLRMNVTDNYDMNNVLTMDVEFYIPKN